MPQTVWIFAGEESGDRYGARLARELRALRPELVLRGMGGHAMAGAGVEILVDSSELGVVGLFEVLRHLPEFVGIFRGLVARAEDERPDAVVLIDYPGFNLRFAKQMHRRGIPVVYYVSPQVWAWKKGRIPKIARWVRTMMCIFPFEPAVYEGTGLNAEFIGHPLLEALSEDRDASLVRDPNLVQLLPGSRRSEVSRLLIPMLGTAARVSRDRPDLRFVITLPRERIAAYARELRDGADLPPDLPDIPIEVGTTRRRMQQAGAGLAASGTVTVEAAILGLPLVVVYRLHPLTYVVARMLVKLPSFTIANLVTGRRVFEEYLQGDVNAEVLSAALARILPGGERHDDVLQGMADTVASLGGDRPASRRAAECVLAVVDE